MRVLSNQKLKGFYAAFHCQGEDGVHRLQLTVITTAVVFFSSDYVRMRILSSLPINHGHY